MVNFNHIHSSSRFDRTPESLHKAVKSYASKCSVITLTEVSREHREKALILDGWGVSAGDKSGWDDCAIMYRLDRWKLEYEQSFNMGGTGRYARIVVLRDKTTGKRSVWASVHYPASVETELSQRRRTADSIMWTKCVWSLKNRVNELRRQVDADYSFICADWNVNFKRRWVRTLIKSIHPKWANAWRAPYPTAGTHRGRLIDATLFRFARLVHRARLLPDDPSSDHRPYIETFA